MSPSSLHPARVYRRGGVHDPVLRRGYEACRRARGDIEYAVSLLLPPPLRIATWALYGAGVTVDCLVDTAQPSDTKGVAPSGWRRGSRRSTPICATAAAPTRYGRR
ncbi:hypothetical protein [Streptomyces chartreusis]|uniref:hypothetical protein n=1 Tax=Streptomyces chartreusis TaxID=1969 RepID=UPI0033AD19C3